VFAAGGLLPAACGRPATNETEAMPALSKEPVTIHTDGMASYAPFWEFLIPRFTAKFPSVAVQAEGVATLNVDYQAKVTAMAAGGQLGDALYFTTVTGHFDVLVATQQLRALDDLARASDFDLKAFYKASTDAVTRAGKLYGLPNVSHPANCILYYNTQMLANTGVAAPTPEWTPDDALAAARRLTQPDRGIWGYQCPATAPMTEAMIQAFGGRWLSADGKRSELSTAQAQQGIAYMADLFNRHQVAAPPSVITATFPKGDPVFGITSGMVGMYIGITTNANDMLAAAPQVEVGTSLLPRVRPGLPRGLMRVDGFGVTTSSKHPREAWELVKYVTGPEIALARAQVPGQQGAFGSVVSAWNDPGLMTKRGVMQQMFARVMGEAETFPIAWNFRNQECEDVLTQKLAPAWSGQTPVSNALMNDLQQTTQATLDKPKLA
jgi:multiple sugar transport system substrate-binding protein